MSRRDSPMQLRKPSSPLAMLVACCLAALVASGCANVSHRDRIASAQVLVASSGWVLAGLPGAPYPLMSAQPRHPAGTRHVPSLVVYIEGDGLAWISRDQPSLDPTPINPIALRLALAHPVQPGEAVAWLGRPCQYLRSTDCRIATWTSHRFSADVVASTQMAIDQLKEKSGADTLTLVGHSGGGVLAALVASRRNDVGRLVTIASPLDHARWTQALSLTPLTGSLNPVHDAERLRRIDQVHLVGGKDSVVPSSVVHGFVHALKAPPTASAHQAPKLIEVIELDGFDHLCCWASEWPVLSRQIRDRFRTTSVP